MFVSAAIQSGASHRIVQAWLAGEARFDVVMCPELLAEIPEALTTRSRLRRWVDLKEAVAYVDTVEALVDLVEAPAFIKPRPEIPTTTTWSRSPGRTTSR